MARYTLHVDNGVWATKLHHTHVCQHCGHVWRPAVCNTIGVDFLPGMKDVPEAKVPAEQGTFIPADDIRRTACDKCVEKGTTETNCFTQGCKRVRDMVSKEANVDDKRVRGNVSDKPERDLFEFVLAWLQTENAKRLIRWTRRDGNDSYVLDVEEIVELLISYDKSKEWDHGNGR